VPKPKLDKPTPLDYLVMFGGPILFIIIFAVGILSLLGPAPPKPPVQRLREGVVQIGMSAAEVRQRVGAPKAVTERADGGTTFRYEQSTWDNARGVFLEEDGYVDFSAGGTVTAVTFEARVPPTSADPP
jgi:hypothetical protein